MTLCDCFISPSHCIIVYVGRLGLFFYFSVTLLLGCAAVAILNTVSSLSVATSPDKRNVGPSSLVDEAGRPMLQLYGACTCNGNTTLDHGTGQLRGGHCAHWDDRGVWCYVDKGVCPDTGPHDGDNGHWSAAACGVPFLYPLLASYSHDTRMGGPRASVYLQWSCTLNTYPPTLQASGLAPPKTPPLCM